MAKKWARALYTPNLPLGSDGSRVTESKQHIEISKNAAKEGMVLLKNEGHVLPLPQGSRIALFGKGTIDYVKGGGGSGDVTVSFVHNLADGFASLGDEVTVFPDTVDFYRSYVTHQYAKGGKPGLIAEPELPEELVKKAASVSDIAVISISRFSGEAWDRKSSYGSPELGIDDDKDCVAAQNELFESSDFYLSKAEQAMVDQVTAAFARTVVVLNVGGMVDTEWFRNNAQIPAVLLAWQGGMEGGTAEAELLMGHGTPSGRLADTFAKRLEDYPSSEGFHQSTEFVDYTEDIYVGYRYFETIPGAKEKVNYPFGFGLSYTTFSLTHIRARQDGDRIVFAVHVTNTGEYAGKEVVQVYYAAPQGLLGKPARSLGAYRKTRLLQPGETQTLALSIAIRDMASYDDLARIQNSSWVLEKGDYTFFLGTSVEDAAPVDYIYHLDDNVITQRLTRKLAPTQLQFRLRADGTFENLPQSEPHDPNETLLPPLPHRDGMSPEVRYREGHTWQEKPDHPMLIDVFNGKAPMEELLSRLSDEDLCWLVSGQPNTGSANTFGWGGNADFGIPNIMTADGPAGLRLRPEVGVHTTAFPCATLLACTWDPDVTYAVGRAGAAEVKENNIGVWLTPAVNIHRSPLCGRNFEYYSEDPLLAGRQAAGMVKGIQSEHVAACVKHFALNNKETNRRCSDSRCSERAIREIYLKQFEIIVKEAHPWSVMSSYNLINGVRASESKGLLTGILREEWGFDGVVTTDWWNLGEQYKEVKAGGDVKMGCGFPARLLEALHKGYVSRTLLEQSAGRILELILKMD